MKRPRCMGCWSALALLMLAAGCGDSNLGKVSGTVTLDGEPLPEAMLVFTPLEGGRPAAAMTDAQGNYELIYDRDSQGAELGEHVVEITTYQELAEGDTVRVIPEKVPARYNAPSELRAQIEKGENVIDFPLESGGEILESPEESAET